MWPKVAFISTTPLDEPLATAYAALERCGHAEVTIIDVDDATDPHVLHIADGGRFEEVAKRAGALAVMGPIALLECITSHETPSLTTPPVVNFALRGVAVCTTSFATKEKDQLHRQIQLMVRCAKFHPGLRSASKCTLLQTYPLCALGYDRTIVCIQHRPLTYLVDLCCAESRGGSSQKHSQAP